MTEVLRVINQTLLRRVARVTSGREYIAEIDGLRFIAILSVVLFHLNGYVIEKDVGVAASPMAQRVSALFAQGHFGVQLFFVISGFVLLLPFAAAYREGTPRPAIAWYFRRRLTRLEPPYVFNMTVVAILAWVTHKASLAEIAPHFLASVTYTHNAIYHAMSTINSVAWSLEVEVQFYIVAPLIAFVFAIRKRWMRIVLFVGAAAVAVSFQRTDTGDPNALNLLGSIQYFLMGAILADAYLVDWARTPRSTLRWDFVLIGAWAATPWLVPALDPIVSHRFLLPLLMLVTAIAAFRSVCFRQFVRLPWIAAIGGMCYTIYLYHYLVISLVGRLTLPRIQSGGLGLALGLEIIFILPVILAACGVLFVLFERPFMSRTWVERFRAQVLRTKSTEPLAQSTS